MGLSWGCEEKGKKKMQKHAFWWGKQYIFIILRTFVRGRMCLQILLVIIITK